MPQPPAYYYYYLPLLETVPAKIYLDNSASSGLVLDSYDGITPTAQETLDTQAIRISKNSDSLSQGKLSLSVVTRPSDSLTVPALLYSGTKWADTTTILPSTFSLIVEQSDIAWFIRNPNPVMDLSAIRGSTIVPPNPPVGPHYFYSGGSRLEVSVLPLVWPEVAAISPSTVTGGTTQDLTITLKRPLHPTQNPTVTFSCPGGQLIIAPGAPRANKNQNGGIISWTVTVTTSSQPSTASITMTAVDPALEHMDGDALVTSAVSYLTNVTIGSIMNSGAAVTIPPAITSVQVLAPNGSLNTPSTDGWVGASGGKQAYSGKILVNATVSSPSNNFSTAGVIAKQSGTTSRINLGNATTVGSPYVGTDSSGNTLYFQDYSMIVDTGVSLNQYSSYDIGYTATAGGVTTTSWVNNVFANQNITQQFSSYSIDIVQGTNEWTSTGLPTTTWSGTGLASSPTPVLTTTQSISIGDLWGSKTVSSGVDSVLKQEIYVTGPGKTNELVSSVSGRNADGTLSFATVDTTAWSAGYYDFTFRIYSKATTYKFDGVNSGFVNTPPQSLQVSHTYFGGGGCFIGNTYVLTVDGPKKIEDIKVGDFVITVSDKEFEAGRFELMAKKVINKLVHSEKMYETVNLNGIITTPEHPWATSDYKFTEVSEMGDKTKVMSVDLTNKTIVPVSAILTPDTPLSTVFNLSVEDTRTFLVAPNMFGPWYLVHNMKKIEYLTIDPQIPYNTL